MYDDDLDKDEGRTASGLFWLVLLMALIVFVLGGCGGGSDQELDENHQPVQPFETCQKCVQEGLAQR